MLLIPDDTRSAAWEPEVLSGAESSGSDALVAEERQCEVDAFDLAEPAFGLGSLETVEEIGLELAQAGEHLGVDVEHGAADAGVRVVAGVP
jgi:hypothetical protein